MASKMYSHSKLGTYETCPRKYHFQYIEKLQMPEAPPSVESLLGTCVHESLETLYRNRQMEKVWDLPTLLADFETRWEEADGPGALVLDTRYVADDYRRVGIACLEKYHQRHHPFDRTQVIGIEMPVMLDLGGGVLLRGYIDRVDRVADGFYEIHDYKTARNLPLQKDADEDRQLALYQIAVQERFPDATDITLVWHYLRFDTEIRSSRTGESLESMKTTIRSLVEEIESCNDFVTRVTRLCDWCDFKPVCPAWSHPVSVSALPPREFRADEGVSLVDRYVEVRDDRLRRNRELQAETSGLKEEEDRLLGDIAAFAKQHGFERVSGSANIATVETRHAWELPSKEEAERHQALLETCRQLGIWDEIAQLDSKVLVRLLEERESVRQALEGLIERTEIQKVRVTKLKSTEKV